MSHTFSSPGTYTVKLTATNRAGSSTKTAVITVQQGFVFNDVVSASMLNYNLNDRAVAAGWNQVLPLIATVTVNSGVVVGSAATTTPAFTVNTVPSGSSLRLNVSPGAYIVGRGGDGGYGGGDQPDMYQPGLGGGPALWTSSPISIDNQGVIGGGGGGGGGGGIGSWTHVNEYGTPLWTMYACGGGGGGGAGNVAGACARNGDGTGGWLDINGGGTVTGSGGTLTLGGVGGAAGSSLEGSAGVGGTGGNLGQAGASGGTGTGGHVGRTGGAGGQAVIGNSYITWIATGARYGSLL